MGTYIAHTRRKLKTGRAPSTPTESDAAAIAAREQELAARREAERIEMERARAEKAARAMRRAIGKRMHAGEADTSGRRRTAVRAAGIMLISATGGLRTQSVSLYRLPGSAGADLWRADVQFDTERGVTHYMNDPATPADKDALHAMRALAPRIAELLFMGPPYKDEIDRNNFNTANRLAESFMHKTQYTSNLTEEEKSRLTGSIFEELQNVAAMRLRHMSGELEAIVGTLMQKTKMSRSECNASLDRIYQGFEEFQRGGGEPTSPSVARMTPPAPASGYAPPPERFEDEPAATGTHGR
jgi:hypothetical protein